jgi:hypothetical protein
MEWCWRGLYLRKSAFISPRRMFPESFRGSGLRFGSCFAPFRVHSRSQFAGEMVGGDVHSVS